jgi:hypothetical protein
MISVLSEKVDAVGQKKRRVKAKRGNDGSWDIQDV